MNIKKISSEFRSINKKIVTTILFLMLFSFPITHVNSSLISFTNELAWDSTVGPFTSEDFNSVLVDTPFQAAPITVNDLTLTSFIPLGFPQDQFNMIDALPGNGFGLDFTTTHVDFVLGLGVDEEFRIDFANPVSAWGATFINFEPFHSSAFDVYDGTTNLGTIFAFNGETAFHGFNLDAGETSTHLIFSTAMAYENVAMDNAKFMASSISVPASVPEPGTMILLGSGLMALVGFNYKRKKQTART